MRLLSKGHRRIVFWLAVWGAVGASVRATIWIPSLVPTYKEAAAIPTPMPVTRRGEPQPRIPQAWMLRGNDRSFPFVLRAQHDAARPTFHVEPDRGASVDLKPLAPDTTAVPLHDLALRVSAASRPSGAIPVARLGRLPEPPSPNPPRTAVEYLLADRRLTNAQRQRVETIVARFEERDRVYRDALRDELERLQRFVAGELTESEARRVLNTLQKQRDAETRLLEETLQELHVVLSPRQWDRFTAWIRRRPWMPFHRPIDTAHR